MEHPAPSMQEGRLVGLSLLCRRTPRHSGDGLRPALGAACSPHGSAPELLAYPTPRPQQGVRAWGDTGGTASPGGVQRGGGHGWVASGGVWVQHDRAACLSIHHFVYPSVCPSVCSCIRVSVHPSVHPCVHLPIHLSVRPSVCPSIHPSDHPWLPSRARPHSRLQIQPFLGELSPAHRHPHRAAARDGIYLGIGDQTHT